MAFCSVFCWPVICPRALWQNNTLKPIRACILWLLFRISPFYPGQGVKLMKKYHEAVIKNTRKRSPRNIPFEPHKGGITVFILPVSISKNSSDVHFSHQSIHNGKLHFCLPHPNYHKCPSWLSCLKEWSCILQRSKMNKWRWIKHSKKNKKIEIVTQILDVALLC